ncbi:MAG TPA: SusD/RagB family nutrient-binding outer membrane lipoprotein [Cyclobacteriaceae bacterium]|nr:SusD/RagB family nutrient-binding outer membrane lipoprotein [Cyclobacteriaceae bacterium]
MRKKILFFLLSVGVMSFVTSCDENLADLNVDPKQPTEVPAEVLFTYGQFNLVKQLTNADYNHNVDLFWSNFLTQTTYIQEASYDAANRDVGGSIWDNIYTECLFELADAKRILRAEEATPATEPIINNQLAMIKVLEVYAYQYLVDNFGPVPFREALDINNVVPAYDDADFIYAAITDSLQNAISMLDAGAAGFSSSADILYGGDIEKWQKFANSLLLKIGIRLADVDATTASALINDAVNGGVFESNDDNAVFQFLDSQPYVNPIWDYFVYDNRASDFVATQFFLDILEDRNDPRIAAYFDDNEVPYVGGVYGGVGNAYNSLTHVNTAITNDATFPGTLLDYSFVAFTLAEAVERSFIAGDAAAYYEAGIRASFESWGLSETDADNYLAEASVDYSTAPGDFKQKIGMQKYIALFNQGHEAWTEARRLNTPELLPAASNSRPNPRRMIYPTTEKLINSANYSAALAAFGGNDDTAGRIFWDVDN